MAAAEPATRERITIPVDADRAPDATTLVAATLARQSGLALEFVAVADERRPGHLADELQRRCATAVDAGAPAATWQLLQPGHDDLGTYLTWSGSCLRCSGRARRSSPTLGATGAVPHLVVGPAFRPSARYRLLVAGIDGPSGRGGHVASVAAGLARRLDAEVALLEVFAPGGPAGDVPECAYLHHVLAHVETGQWMFETLHDRDPARGIVRFLGAAAETIIVVGTRRRGHGRRGVPGALVRRAPCPVLVVPPGAVPMRAVTLR